MKLIESPNLPPLPDEERIIADDEAQMSLFGQECEGGCGL